MKKTYSAPSMWSLSIKTEAPIASSFGVNLSEDFVVTDENDVAVKQNLMNPVPVKWEQ